MSVVVGCLGARPRRGFMFVKTGTGGDIENTFYGLSRLGLEKVVFRV